MILDQSEQPRSAPLKTRRSAKAKERYLPFGDTWRAKATPSVDRRESQEVLPIEDNMKNATPHSQFISFSHLS